MPTGVGDTHDAAAAAAAAPVGATGAAAGAETGVLAAAELAPCSPGVANVSASRDVPGKKALLPKSDSGAAPAKKNAVPADCRAKH